MLPKRSIFVFYLAVKLVFIMFSQKSSKDIPAAFASATSWESGFKCGKESHSRQTKETIIGLGFSAGGHSLSLGNAETALDKPKRNISYYQGLASIFEMD